MEDFLFYSKILNQINHSNFSVNAIITAHAHTKIVTANTLPKNTPSLCQISVIFINPFKTRKISNADMTIITIMNRVKPHHTS